MGVDRDAPAIVGDREGAIGMQMHLDAIGMAGDGFVHGVVEDFRGQMVQGAFIGTADIHARAPAHRFQSLEDLNVLSGIVAAARRGIVEQSWVFGFAFGACHGGLG